MRQPAFDYMSLSIEDRLQLVGDIWDSIADAANASPDVLPLSEAHIAELNRRLADADARPGDLIPMDEAMARVRSKIKQARKGSDHA